MCPWKYNEFGVGVAIFIRFLLFGALLLIGIGALYVPSMRTFAAAHKNYSLSCSNPAKVWTLGNTTHWFGHDIPLCSENSPRHFSPGPLFPVELS